jgi:hypothetical protein
MTRVTRVNRGASNGLKLRGQRGGFAVVLPDVVIDEVRIAGPPG